MSEDISSSETTAPLVPDGHLRTYMDVIRDIQARFRDGGVPDWVASAEWLAMDALQCTRTELYSNGNHVVRPDQMALLERWVSRRLAREPVQYIVGYSEFCGLKLRVNPTVLIPRPETELLVDTVVKAMATQTSPVRILDIGTGSGCIALGIKKALPHAELVATDYSDDVLFVARKNGDLTGLAVEWVKWNLLAQERPPIAGRFTAIVSNPPYIPISEADTVMPEVRLHEPEEALFVANDPLIFYRAILSVADELVDDGGYVFFEVNPDFASEIQQLMVPEDYFSSGIGLDLSGHKRIVWGRRNG